MPKIEFLDVTKTYGKVIAVENLNFTINNGEYVSLLGPSGCGKTTTLRMLSGLILPTQGEILWDGKPVQDLPPDERNIGYVFQQFAIFPHLNVWENVAYTLEVKGFSKNLIEDKVEEYLKLVGLEDKANLFPKNLTAGDLQRTGIARVLASGAKVLLLDEPFGALDHKIREQFQDELRKIVKELNLTAIHVTHDQSEAMAISDKIGVMKKGHMIQIGTPIQLLFNPTNIFTAHFIGESNFLEGVVSKKEENSITTELLGGSRLKITDGIEPFVIGDRIILGIRNEFVKISKNEEENSIGGSIKSDIFLGEKRRTVIDLDFGRLIEVIRLPFEKEFQVDEKVFVVFPSENLFVFRFPREGLEEALEVT